MGKGRPILSTRGPQQSLDIDRNYGHNAARNPPLSDKLESLKLLKCKLGPSRYLTHDPYI
jgi:hypothetical protein